MADILDHASMSVDPGIDCLCGIIFFKLVCIWGFFARRANDMHIYVFPIVLFMIIMNTGVYKLAIYFPLMMIADQLINPKPACY